MEKKTVQGRLKREEMLIVTDVLEGLTSSGFK
jgi:hypothetical protein